jgi:hypothetical protein
MIDNSGDDLNKTDEVVMNVRYKVKAKVISARKQILGMTASLLTFPLTQRFSKEAIDINLFQITLKIF